MVEKTHVEAGDQVEVTVSVNGKRHISTVSTRTLLSDYLRQQLKLTGTHVGCEHGVCGACTVHIDGRPARSCLTLAVQVDGREVRTVEGLASEDGTMHPVQQAFSECHALQCGFCTPGFMMSVAGVLDERDDVLELDDEALREEIAGNICRCTGYMNIVAAARRAAELGQEKR
jgi:carbon-monoxide dehydrogenase small subunit